jgi:ribonucleotide reductase alpha subunit
MQVEKRDGRRVPVEFDKITQRIAPLCDSLTSSIDPVLIAQKVVEGVHDGVKTSELDTLAAETCAYMSQKHPDFSRLAARISASNLQKNTPKTFSACVEQMFNTVDKRGKHAPLCSEEIYKVVMANKDRLDVAVKTERDMDFDFFGFKTMEKSYLLRDPVSKTPVETPQYLFMRVSLGIHGEDIEGAMETYELMSSRHFIHATPTLFNTGTNNPHMSS